MAATMDMTNHKTSIYLNITISISKMSGNSYYHRVTILYGKNLANHQMAPKLPFLKISLLPPIGCPCFFSLDTGVLQCKQTVAVFSALAYNLNFDMPVSKNNNVLPEGIGKGYVNAAVALCPVCAVHAEPQSSRIATTCCKCKDCKKL